MADNLVSFNKMFKAYGRGMDLLAVLGFDHPDLGICEGYFDLTEIALRNTLSAIKNNRKLAAGHFRSAALTYMGGLRECLIGFDYQRRIARALSDAGLSIESSGATFYTDA